MPRPELHIVTSPGPGHSLNAYHTRLYAELEALGARVGTASILGLLREKPNVWHIHWPENHATHPSWLRSAYRVTRLLTTMVVARLRGVRIVWTVHNLAPHENPHPRLASIAAAAWVRLIDGYICLTERGREAAISRFPSLARLPSFVIPHGHYRGLRRVAVSRAEARGALKIDQDETVVLFAGVIRDYKNLPELIRVVQGMHQPHPILVVAGQPWAPRIDHEVRQAAAGDSRIRLFLGRVPDVEFERYFRASDLAVLPFRAILNSGSAMLALSYDLPILVPEFGAMPELQTAVGVDWVRTYRGDLTSPEITGALLWVRRTAPTRDRAPLDAFEWDAIAASTLDAFASVVDTRSASATFEESDRDAVA